jgi:hypothetical protein
MGGNPGVAAVPGRAPGGWRLSLSRLLARSPRAAREVFVVVADLDGDRKQELVAVSGAGHVQLWRWKGGRFTSILFPRPLLALHLVPHRCLGAGDIDGDRKEELLLVSETGPYAFEMRAYGYGSGRWRLKLRRPIDLGLMGADVVDQLVGVVGGAASERFLVAVTHNIEDADKNLLFFRVRGGRLERLPRVELGPLMAGPSGPVIVDLDRDGVAEVLIGTGGELFAPAVGNARFAPRVLQSYTWSNATGRIARVWETSPFPPALGRLLGQVAMGGQTLLVGVEGTQVVLCRKVGPDFAVRRTGISLRGDPVACGDLLGDGNSEVVSLESATALHISPPVAQF